MKIIRLEQRSKDWLIWRNTGIGSSDAAVLLNGVHFGRTAIDLWEEKTGLKTSRIFASSAMQRGIDLEPLARAIYLELVGHDPIPISCVHDEHDFLKASLDGWIEQHKIAVEIKAPNKKDHQDALDGVVPHKYIPQVLHLCLVTGCKKLHYVSYSDFFPNSEQFALVEYTPEPSKLKQLFDLEQQFWQHVLSRTPPVLS